MQTTVAEQVLDQATQQFRDGLRADAIQTLLDAAPAIRRKRPFAEAAVRLMLAHGARVEALACVDAVLAEPPVPRAVRLLRVDLLVMLGRLQEAAETLASIKPGPGGAYWKTRLSFAFAAGDAQALLADLDLARAALPRARFVDLYEIKALLALCDARGAAARIESLVADRPDDMALNLERVRCRRMAEGAAAALPLAQDLVARFGDSVAAHTMLGEILKSTGAVAEAQARFEHAAEIDPDNPMPHLWLAKLALSEGAFALALERSERALARGPGLPGVLQTHAQCLVRAGRPEAARALYEDSAAGAASHPMSLAALASAIVAEGSQSEAAELLRAGLEQFPDNSVLLDRIIRQGAATAPDLALAVLDDRLAGRLPEAKLCKLRAHLLMQALDFDAALAELRKTAMHQRDADHATKVATILTMTNRLAFAMRYLTMAIRHWPADRRLAERLVEAFAKAGRDEIALNHLLQAADRANAEADLHAASLVTVYAHLEQPDAALACHRKAVAQGMRAIPQPTATLLHSLIAHGRADAVAPLIHEARALGLWSAPHFQTNPLAGSTVTEAVINLNAPGQGALRSLDPDDTEGHIRLIEDFPKSNIAAPRFLRHWRHISPPAEHRRGAPAIPRRIFQYWDDADPPEGIAEMVESWRNAPGFRHRLFDRRQALDLLRTKFGPKWTRAFLMANNPAEEADYLRLCLLVAKGGVYADADDILTGRLDDLIDTGSGLVAVLEPGMTTIANNFIAAVPRHPALMLAARLARSALLGRANESTWAKTGPAMLTRAVAIDLARRTKTGTPVDTGFLTYRDLYGTVALHNPARHKKGTSDWRQAGARHRADPLGRLLDDLASRPAGSGQSTA